MHFSIPDTQEFIDSAGNPYVGYNIHINGLFHCTLRYKQLHNLHEQLAKEQDISLPTFPPKKFFPLTISQQEERRVALEKYIQSIGQNVVVTNSGILNGFLLSAQQESIGGPIHNGNLDVSLMNGTKITISVSTGENSEDLLKKVCKQLRLLDQYHSYFALYIIAQDDTFQNGDIYVLRKLQNFESPFISLKNMYTIGTKIVLAKNYWDITYDLELFNDVVALHLLYIQAVAEIQRGWVLATTEEVKGRLLALHKKEKRKEYLDVARTLKYYGYIQFAPCYCDYIQSESKVLVSIGRNELNLRVFDSDNEQHEMAFKVSRMRCWRITTLQNGLDRSEECDFNLELSFEYLIAKNQLQWITITSEQAILMSVCLQSMIDELLLKTVGGNKCPQTSVKPWTYIMRDGQSRITMGATSQEEVEKNSKTNLISSHPQKSDPLMKKLVDKLSVVKTKRTERRKSLGSTSLQRKPVSEGDVMENNAFRMIGDDDL